MLDRNVVTWRVSSDTVVSDPRVEQVLVDASAGDVNITLISRTGGMAHEVAVKKLDGSFNVVNVQAGDIDIPLVAGLESGIFSQDDLGVWHVFSNAVSLGAPGRFATNTLQLADDTADGQTITIGDDVYEVEVVNTDSTDDTDNDDFANTTSPLTVIDAVLSYPGVTFTAGALIRIEDEILRVTDVAGDDVTFQRGVSGTDIAAHADAEDIFIGDGIDPGSTVAVGLVTDLTPEAFAPALTADINSQGTEPFTAEVGEDDTSVVITAGAAGDAHNGVVCATSSPLDAEWVGPVTFGGSDPGSEGVINDAAAGVVPLSDGTNLINSHIAELGDSIYIGSFAVIAGINLIGDAIRLSSIELGFYGETPVERPEVPAVPTEQDIVDALVLLGLITQAP